MSSSPNSSTSSRFSASPATAAVILPRAHLRIIGTASAADLPPGVPRLRRDPDTTRSGATEDAGERVMICPDRRR